MAKYKIKWRHIWRNLPMVTFMVQELVWSWPAVKAHLGTVAESDGEVGDFCQAADRLYRTIVRRRK